MALRTASYYGAKGTGLVDDSVALQRMLNACQPGDIASLQSPKKKYLLNKGLTLQSSDVQIWGYDSLLIGNTSAYPDNTMLHINSGWATPVPFQATIMEGWFLLPVSGSGWLMLGDDPYDANEEHFGIFIDKGASRVRVPYDINGVNHKFVPLGKICERIHLRDLHVTTLPGKITDTNIWLNMTRHITLDGLRGDVTIGCQVSDSEHVIIRNLDVNLTYPEAHTSSGRAVSLWQTRNFDISNVKIKADNTPPNRSRGFFLESWCRYGCINNVDMTFSTAGLWYGTAFPYYFMTGGCQDVDIPYTTVRDKSLVYPHDTGGTPNQQPPRIGTIEVLEGSLSLVDDYEKRGWACWKKIIRPSQ